MLLLKVLVIIYLTEVSVIRSARIVGIFGMPSLSPVMMGEILLKELARRGHVVTMITHFPSTGTYKNFDLIQLSLDKDVKEYYKKTMLSITEGAPLIGLLHHVVNAFYQVSKGMFENQKLQNFIKETSSIDLLIIQAGFHEAFLGLAHKFGAPVVALSHFGSCYAFGHITGSPLPYATVPDIFTSYTDHMSFMERVSNTLQSTYLSFMISTVNGWLQEKLKQKYFPNTPPLQGLIQNITINLLHSHFSTETIRAKTPGNIDIAGFHLYREKVAIPSDIQKFLDDAHEGVILMSFGTHINNNDIGNSMSDSIFHVINNQKMKILFRYDKVLKNIGSHVMIKNWIPQFEILAHPNIKLFITHGGLNSFIEASFHGIPIVGLPFMLDQPQNIALAVQRGFGVKVHSHNFTKESFSAAIKEALENPSFKINALKHKDIFTDREVNPMDSAIYWVEYALRHKGAPHLKNKSNSIPLYQYLLLDVLLFLSFVSIAIVLTFYLIFIRFTKLIRFLLNRKVKKS